MKKLFVILLLFAPFLGWSQENDKPKDLSIVAGSGLSYVFGGEKLTPGFGYTLGFEKNAVQFTDKSLLNMGVVISTHGIYYDEIATREDASISGRVNLSYIGLPILYRHQFPGGFFWEAGIQTAFVISGKDHPEEGEKTDYKEYVKKVDFGIPIGLGYWFKNRFSMGMRAVYGLTDMSANGAKILPQQKNHRNFLLTAMFRYNITGK
jgi:hypothetical protein